MYLFYSQRIGSEQLYLTDQEATHCVKVLRHRTGDSLHAIDGRGGYYEGTIASADKKLVTVTIDKKSITSSTQDLELAFGIIKNTTRLEWMIEKATEIGVKTLQPLICQRSEKRHIKAERLEKIILSACKQSKQLHFPELLPPLSVSAYLAKWVGKTGLIAHFMQGQENIWEKYHGDKKPLSLMIGPEGDFTDEEVRQAIGRGFTPVNLGESRLRAETAALVACAHVNT